MDDPFDTDECGSDELDDSRFIVRSIHVPGADWLGKAVVGYLVFFDKAPIEAIDRGSTIDVGFGDESLSKVFLRTDRAMRNDLDCLSATITLLTVSGGLCIQGELLFKNPVHKV